MEKVGRESKAERGVKETYWHGTSLEPECSQAVSCGLGLRGTGIADAGMLLQPGQVGIYSPVSVRRIPVVTPE
jgi:hypothetical protein